jgi:quinol monooxygenase YgiN
MILIIAKATVKKDKLDEFKSVALELIKSSRTEDGCIEYSLYENNEDPYCLTFVEKWRDQEAVNQHGGTDFFKKSIENIQSYSENLEISFNSEI